MRKKMGLYLIVSLLLISMAFMTTGCPAPQQVEPPEQEAAPPPEPAVVEPVRGGTLRMIFAAGPRALSYVGVMGPTEVGAIFPAMERLLRYNSEKTLEPWLAESWTEDPAANTITFNIRQGVRFHDGTELTAEVVRWNLQRGIDYKRHVGITNLEVTGPYTLVVHLEEWTNQIIHDLAGRGVIFSQAAYEAVYQQQGKEAADEWARNNIVGTGPFKLEKFERDVGITWVRNDDYWREGYPYLDRVEIVYIPDEVTAAAMMEAGEAHIWNAATPAKQAELEARGFIRQIAWPGMPTHIWPNLKDPESPLADKRVREALEYALDKEGIVTALGFGYAVPMNVVAIPGTWGSELPLTRPYNPERAKQLLAEAGYPDGLELTLLALVGAGGRNEWAEAIKGSLETGGFRITLDIADPGRFFSSYFVGGWEDLAFGFSGVDPFDLTSVFRWFGAGGTPIGSYAMPPELAEIVSGSILTETLADQEAATVDIVEFVRDEALVIPVAFAPTALMISSDPFVHTTYPAQGLINWDYWDIWIEDKP